MLLRKTLKAEDGILISGEFDGHPKPKPPPQAARPMRVILPNGIDEVDRKDGMTFGNLFPVSNGTAHIYPGHYDCNIGERFHVPSWLTLNRTPQQFKLQNPHVRLEAVIHDPNSTNLTITGRVFHPNGKPWPEVGIRLATSPANQTTSDKNGRFQLPAPLEPWGGFEERIVARGPKGECATLKVFTESREDVVLVPRKPNAKVEFIGDTNYNAWIDWVTLVDLDGPKTTNAIVLTPSGTGEAEFPIGRSGIVFNRETGPLQVLDMFGRFEEAPYPPLGITVWRERTFFLPNPPSPDELHAAHHPPPSTFIPSRHFSASSGPGWAPSRPISALVQIRTLAPDGQPLGGISVAVGPFVGATEENGLLKYGKVDTDNETMVYAWHQPLDAFQIETPDSVLTNMTWFPPTPLTNTNMSVQAVAPSWLRLDIHLSMRASLYGRQTGAATRPLQGRSRRIDHQGEDQAQRYLGPTRIAGQYPPWDRPNPTAEC